MKTLISFTVATMVLVITSSPGRSDDNWVCALDRDLQTARRLFSVTKVQKLESLSVSPDGQMFAFAGTTPDRRDSRIWTCDLDGGNLRDLGRGTMPSWSPGGQRIVFSRTAPESGVWIMRADGSDQQILDQQGWGAAWSGDGTRISWYRKVAGLQNIVVHNIAEDDFDLVLDAEHGDSVSSHTQIVWSHGGRSLTFLTKGANGLNSICSVDLRSKSRVVVRRQGQVAGIRGIAWLDDQTLVFSKQAEQNGISQLFTSSIKATAASVFAPVGLPVEFRQRSNDSVSLTKDGTRLFFVSRAFGR